MTWSTSASRWSMIRGAISTMVVGVGGVCKRLVHERKPVVHDQGGVSTMVVGVGGGRIARAWSMSESRWSMISSSRAILV